MNPSVRGVGLNLRLRYLDEILETQPRVAFWEVIAENLFENPQALAKCEALRAHYPISLHCVGMNLAGADALDDPYLAFISDLQARLEPFLISDHLCWQRHNGLSHHDLLPFPLTEANTRRVTERVSTVQERLNCRIAVENLSYYVEYRSSSMDEVEVMNEVATTSGCGLLLDLNNIEVNEFNLGSSKESTLARIRLDHVLELHVAGAELVNGLSIDTHGSEPTPFQRRALSEKILSGLPVCYERDRHLPALEKSVALVAELERARQGMTEPTRLSAP